MNRLLETTWRSRTSHCNRLTAPKVNVLRNINTYIYIYYRLSIYRGYIWQDSAHSTLITLIKFIKICTHGSTTSHTSLTGELWNRKGNDRDISRAHCMRTIRPYGDTLMQPKLSPNQPASQSVAGHNTAGRYKCFAFLLPRCTQRPIVQQLWNCAMNPLTYWSLVAHIKDRKLGHPKYKQSSNLNYWKT